MPFELRIALRYLLAQRKQVFISVISSISTLGVVVGVMILLIALAILTGFHAELRSRILGAASHLSIYSLGSRGFVDYREVTERVSEIDGVLGAAPVIYGKALVSSQTGSGLATLKGVDPEKEASVTEFNERMVSGELNDLLVEASKASDEGSSAPPIILGEELASSLGVGVLDTVTVLSPEGHMSPFGMIPRTRTFRVVGIFRLGLYDFDSAWALMKLSDTQRMMSVGDEAMFVETKIADLYDVKAVGERVREQLGLDYQTMDWMETNQSLFSAFWLEKIVTTIFISFIVGVAALNIVANQIMIVMEKTRDIAILRSMGAGVKSIMAVFMLQGAIIGIVGTAIGAALGVSVCWVLDRYRLIRIPEDVYQVTFVPFTLLPSDFILVVTIAPLVCFLATLYPARRAARLVVTDALRFQ